MGLAGHDPSSKRTRPPRAVVPRPGIARVAELVERTRADFLERLRRSDAATPAHALVFRCALVDSRISDSRHARLRRIDGRAEPRRNRCPPCRTRKRVLRAALEQTSATEACRMASRTPPSKRLASGSTGHLLGRDGEARFERRSSRRPRCHPGLRPRPVHPETKAERAGLIARARHAIALGHGFTGLLLLREVRIPHARHDLFDLFVAERAARAHRDRLLALGRQIAGRDSSRCRSRRCRSDLDLRLALAERRDVVEDELAEQSRSRRPARSPLHHADLHRRLVVPRRREDVRLHDRHRRVARDQLARNVRRRWRCPATAASRRGAARRLSSVRSTLPWMQLPTATTSSGLTPLMRSLAEVLGDELLHQRHAGLAADQHDVVDRPRR